MTQVARFSFTWRDKPLEFCNKEELLDCIEMSSHFNKIRQFEDINKLKRENMNLRNENARLWKCLGG